LHKDFKVKVKLFAKEDIKGLSNKVKNGQNRAKES
jgi:hypothetical protein